MKYNIFLDESKHFPSGTLILWGFISFHTKTFLDKTIVYQMKKWWHPINREMKSSERDFGRMYLENWFLSGDIHGIWYIFWLQVSDTYSRDTYEQYRDGMIRVITFLLWNGRLNRATEIHIFLDHIRLLSDTQILERRLKKDLQSLIDQRVEKVTLLSSSTSPSIQLADLIVWYYKNEYRGIGKQDFDRTFWSLPHFDPQKNPNVGRFLVSPYGADSTTH